MVLSCQIDNTVKFCQEDFDSLNKGLCVITAVILFDEWSK